jgi:hypothetical protein
MVTQAPLQYPSATAQFCERYRLKDGERTVLTILYVER